MTTMKIAVPQQTQGIQRFFVSSTVKDGIILHFLRIIKSNFRWI